MIGPDAARYLHLANGVRVSRPFCWRWVLPKACGIDMRRWWAVWCVSWPVLAIGMLSLARQSQLGWPAALAAAALMLGLPGTLGPRVTVPVGVDLPATALAVCAAAGFAEGSRSSLVASLLLACTAAAIKETTPLWAALWAWSPLPLVALVAPAARALWVRWRDLEGPDPLGAQFQQIADRPLRTGWEAHRHHWRDASLHVAPWGVCLAALWAVDWRLAAVLAAANLQLLVATDTVRIVHHAAGPAMAVAAASVIPTGWLVPAVAAHTFWWYRVERV